MPMPKIKRVKVSSEQDLRNWLGRNRNRVPLIMVVTCQKNAREKYVSRAQVHDAAADHGWIPARSYTLPGNLIGHVISQV